LVQASDRSDNRPRVTLPSKPWCAARAGWIRVAVERREPVRVVHAGGACHRLVIAPERVGRDCHPDACHRSLGQGVRTGDVFNLPEAATDPLGSDHKEGNVSLLVVARHPLRGGVGADHRPGSQRRNAVAVSGNEYVPVAGPCNAVRGGDQEVPGVAVDHARRTGVHPATRGEQGANGASPPEMVCGRRTSGFAARLRSPARPAHGERARGECKSYGSGPGGGMAGPHDANATHDRSRGQAPPSPRPDIL